MYHIAQTWSRKVSNKSRSPTSDKILSSEGIGTPTVVHCGSWRFRMLTKLKECRDAIKNMMAFDRLSNGSKTFSGAKSNSSTNLVRTMASMSSVPDNIRFSNIAHKYNDYGDELNLMWNSSLNSDEEEQLNASMERRADARNANDSLNRVVLTDNTASSSLNSFLALEKQIKDEFAEEESAFTIKKKISAEPFLSYSEGIAEFVWTDDTTEGSLSGKVWYSLEHLNLTETDFGKPRTNSTFCENSCTIKKNCTSSPIRNNIFQDSGFENNLSI